MCGGGESVGRLWLSCVQRTNDPNVVLMHQYETEKSDEPNKEPSFVQ